MRNAPKHVRPLMRRSVRLPKCVASMVNILPFAKEFENKSNLSMGMATTPQVFCLVLLKDNKYNKSLRFYCEKRKYHPRPPNIAEYENLILSFFKIFFRMTMMDI